MISDRDECDEDRKLKWFDERVRTREGRASLGRDLKYKQDSAMRKQEGTGFQTEGVLCTKALGQALPWQVPAEG